MQDVLMYISTHKRLYRHVHVCIHVHCTFYVGILCSSSDKLLQRRSSMRSCSFAAQSHHNGRHDGTLTTYMRGIREGRQEGGEEGSREGGEDNHHA